MMKNFFVGLAVIIAVLLLIPLLKTVVFAGSFLLIPFVILLVGVGVVLLVILLGKVVRVALGRLH